MHDITVRTRSIADIFFVYWVSHNPPLVKRWDQKRESTIERIAPCELELKAAHGTSHDILESLGSKET